MYVLVYMHYLLPKADTLSDQKTDWISFQLEGLENIPNSLSIETLSALLN